MARKNYTDLTVTIDDIMDENKFFVPSYQRNVVWKKGRRKDFLSNVRKGEPFGVILVRLKNDKYELIDGLQRVSTIKDYMKNKYKYLEYKDVNEELIKDLIRADFESKDIPVVEKTVDDISDEWRKKFYECLKGGLENYEVMTAFREQYGVKDIKSINDIINAIFNDFQDSSDISWLTIQAINYTGPEENIPTVFYNLNTGGVTLSKYETFAALWDRKKYHIDDEDIIEVIKEKFNKLHKDSDLDVDFNEEELREEGITLFEFCYALSGILRKREIVFVKNNKSTDPMGFEILAFLLKKDINKANKLFELLEDVSGEFLVNIKNTIEKAVIIIEQSLEELLTGMNGNYLTSDSMYLIYHIIASYILEYYEFDVENEIITEKESDLKKNDFKKYIKYHYLYDCMTDYWRNHRQVSDLNNALNDLEKRHKYWYKIKREDWDEGVQLFFDNQKYNSKKPSQKNLLFIDFITKQQKYKNEKFNKYFQNVFDGEQIQLDIEHIAPQKRIESHIKDLPIEKQKTYPISAVGNLCYLSMKDNRSKKDKTLYEFAEDRPAYVMDEDYKEAIYYPSKNEIEFLDYDNQSFRESYDKYLKERHEYLERVFLDFIYQV